MSSIHVCIWIPTNSNTLATEDWTGVWMRGDDATYYAYIPLLPSPPLHPLTLFVHRSGLKYYNFVLSGWGTLREGGYGMLSEFNAPRWRTWGEKIGEEYPIVQEWLSERMNEWLTVGMDGVSIHRIVGVRYRSEGPMNRKAHRSVGRWSLLMVAVGWK